jgi:hypothetical protein
VNGIVTSFMKWRIQKVFFLFILYNSCVVYILYKLFIWQPYILKDTLFWFIGGACTQFMNVYKASEKGYFKKPIVEMLKWTILLEFIINLYSFDLLAELFIIPIMTVLSILDYYLKVNKSGEKIYKIINSITAYTGLILISIVFYKTILNYERIFTRESFDSIFIPMLLTIAIVPFIYLIALYIGYEEMFLTINFKVVSIQMKNKVKWSIVKSANISLSKLKRIRRLIYRLVFRNEETLDRYFKQYSLVTYIRRISNSSR